MLILDDKECQRIKPILSRPRCMREDFKNWFRSDTSIANRCTYSENSARVKQLGKQDTYKLQFLPFLKHFTCHRQALLNFADPKSHRNGHNMLANNIILVLQSSGCVHFLIQNSDRHPELGSSPGNNSEVVGTCDDVDSRLSRQLRLAPRRVPVVRPAVRQHDDEVPHTAAVAVAGREHLFPDISAKERKPVTPLAKRCQSGFQCTFFQPRKKSNSRTCRWFRPHPNENGSMQTLEQAVTIKGRKQH